MRRLLALAAALVVLLPGVAAAHGDVGTMEVVVAGPDRVEVGVLHQDGDLAEEATVEATFTHVDGTVVGPVPLPRVSGSRYGADVDLKVGEWTVVARSTGPAAEATATFTVEADAPATTVATTTTSGAPEPVLDEEDEVRWTSFLVPGLVALAVLAIYIGLRRKR